MDTSFSLSFLSVFPPLTLRNGNLHCRQGNRRFSVEELHQIVEETNNKHVSYKQIGEYLQISNRRIKRLKNNFNKGIALNESCRRPSKLGSKQKEDVIQQVILAKDNKNALDTKELKNLIISKSQEYSLERGQNGLKCHSITQQTIDNYINLLDLREEKGQKTTCARRTASLDIRNFITMAAMNEYCGKNKSWHLIGNMDATQFLLQFTSNLRLILIQKDNNPTTKTETKPFDLFTKQFFFCICVGILRSSIIYYCT